MIKNILKDYLLFVILFLIIVILFGIISYDNLNKSSKKIVLQYDSEEIEIERTVQKDNEQYISINDYNKVLGNNIFFDKISRKVIFCTEKNGVYRENINLRDNIIYKGSDIWIKPEFIAKIFNKGLYYIKQANKTAFKEKNNENARLLNKNVDIYYEKAKNKLYNISIDKNSKINVLSSEKNGWVNVLCTVLGKEYYGYILNKNITYKIKKADKSGIVQDKVVIAVSENGVYKAIPKVNRVAVDVLYVNNYNGDISTRDRIAVINKVKKSNIKALATIDNDYLAANYDNNVITSLLMSNINRQNLVNNIVSYCKKNKLAGCVVNFKNLKVTDKEMYTQYIRELKSLMKFNGLELYVKSNIQGYIDTEKIANIADGVILELYNQRLLNSNSSGSHSDYLKVKNIIKEYTSIGLNQKIILEVPLYSILWTERNGIVMSSEIYSDALVKEYIEKNNVRVVLNKGSNQNYFEINRASITYKMWLEDEYALKEKIKIISSEELLGLSVYKLGYETKQIKEVMENEL